ncbi:tripartite motif-containing protein 16-like protein [Sebastes fasciatus]|uniref:tripartite motif-containing protein 16-like protein n=1 Tax=Sebastes fasciatus TaxID=394691 RepID=UPI003D9E93BA
MAQQGVQLDRKTFCCLFCQDLLKDPVTIPCGHSYCMNCLKRSCFEKNGKKIVICPECWHTFTLRPVLMKNTMLADLVEQLKKTGLQAAPADHCYAGPEDLVCDEHKGHDTVSAAAERTERQRELEVSRLNIQQRIQDREKDVKLLQKEVEAVNHSADKAVKYSEKIFTKLMLLMEKRSCDVKQQVRSQQRSEVSRVKELQEKLEQEITELKRRDAELKLLSHTEDNNQFLLSYPSLSPLRESTSSIDIRPLRYFEDVRAAVSEVMDKLRVVLSDKWTNISQTVTEVDVLLSNSQAEPKTRVGFLKYSREITLDPNTAHEVVLLSDGNRKATSTEQNQKYSNHPDRFTECWQVLSRESLTGRCYWEVEWQGNGVLIAVAYKNNRREGGWNECGFGHNDKSWTFRFDRDRYAFWYNNVKTPVSGPQSSRVGVYLDHSAGILSFYSVSTTNQTMTLLHRVQTTFTEPLYAGIWLYYNYGVTAEFCKLK